MIRKEILEKVEACVNGQRDQEYGSLEDNFGRIAGYWSCYLGRDITAEDVAVMMVLLKVSRIQGGNYTPDSWVDIAGYAACGGEISDSKKKGEQ